MQDDQVNPFRAALAEQFGVELPPEAPTPEAPEAPAPIAGLGDLADAVLASIGLAGPDAREGVEEVVRDGARRVGLELGPVSLRYRRLTVTAESTVCALLRLELDRLQAVLDERFPGQVSAIRLKVATGRAARQGGPGGGHD